MISAFGDLRFDALVGKVHLHGPHVHDPPQIDLRPFILTGLCPPPGADILVGDLFRTAAGGYRHGLSVGKQHEIRLFERFGVHGRRPVAVALIAVKFSILVKARFPQAQAALHFVVDGNCHGRRVPVMPMGVLDGGAMARAVGKAAGLVGEGIVFGDRERPQGMFGNEHGIAVYIVLGCWECVLQIVFSVMLGHERPFDVGIIPSKAPGQDAHLFLAGQALFFPHLLRHPHQLAKHFFGSRIDIYTRLGTDMVFTYALIAPSAVVHPEHDPALGERFHSLRVQFHAPDRRDVGAAPIQVQPSVVIQEKVRIPEGKGTGDLLKGFADRVFGAVEMADLTPS